MLGSASPEAILHYTDPMHSISKFRFTKYLKYPGSLWLHKYALREVDESSERERIRSGLLRYCELDTLAMVRIHQFIRETVEVEQ